MKVLFLFLDGVGLGPDDPESNPLARAHLPALEGLLGGRKLLAASAPLDTPRASLRALDAALGVAGLPQSATGQAVLLTGRNVPAELGYHYGPKPNKAIGEIVTNGSLFSLAKKAGQCARFLNAYPPGYFEAHNSGRRIYAAIAMAAVHSGLALADLDDLQAGRALAADFTGEGLRERLGLFTVPVIAAEEAGRRLAQLALECDFSLFEYWLPDYAGHGQDMDAALALLATFDRMLAGLLEVWDDDAGLIVITSDHGNVEDLSTRRHTYNPVPGLVIGSPEAREEFCSGLRSLTDVQPAIWNAITPIDPC